MIRTLFLFLFCTHVVIADSYSVKFFDNDTLAMMPGQTEGLINSSRSFNKPENYNSLQIVIDYDSITPTPCNCEIVAELQSLNDSGNWIAVGAQAIPVTHALDHPRHIVSVSPAMIIDVSQINTNASGVDSRIAFIDDAIPSTLRLALFTQSTGDDYPIESVRLSATGYFYNQ